MSYYNSEKQLSASKISYQAEAALLDCIELFADILPAAISEKHDRIYCYCNIKGSVAVFRSFYTVGDKAVDLRDSVSEADYALMEAKALEKMELVRKFYSYYTEQMPSELFLIYDPISRDVHALKTMEGFTSVYDAEIRFKAWLEEHGGTGKPIGPRTRGFEEMFLWKFFKKGEEKSVNPTASAVEIDMKLLHASRKKVEKLSSPSASVTPNVVDYYLERGAGFSAIKDALDELYPDDNSPDYLYYQDVAELAEDYKLIRKDYYYALYEYIAIYEDIDSWHIVSFGMTELSNSAHKNSNRYDAEISMRIKKMSDEKLDDAESANAINLVALLTDKVCEKKRMPEAYSYVSLGLRKGMDYKRKSDKIAFIIVPDARLSPVETINGTVHFRQAIPISRTEYNALKEKKIDVKTLYEKIGIDIVDYDRPSVI